MGASRIEQLIEDIYEFIESCRMQPLSSTKVIVPKDELYDLLDELRLRTPDEIKRYQKIIANRDAIIADAEEKAENILAQTKDQAKDLLNEHEIMQQAYYQANEMISQASEESDRMRREAQEEADQIRAGALAYTNDVLSEVERVLANAYETSSSKYDGFIGTLKGNLDIVSNNRKEIYDQLYPQDNTHTNISSDDSEFDFDENTYSDEKE